MQIYGGKDTYTIKMLKQKDMRQKMFCGKKEYVVRILLVHKAPTSGFYGTENCILYRIHDSVSPLGWPPPARRWSNGEYLGQFNVIMLKSLTTKYSYIKIITLPPPHPSHHEENLKTKDLNKDEIENLPL